MKDLGDGQRAKARALMPEVARIVKPTNPAMGPRSMVTAPGTVRNFAKGGAVKHSDAAADKKMIKSMVKPSAMKACGGKMATGGAVNSGLGKGAPAGAPAAAPRVKSDGMKPASLTSSKSVAKPIKLAAGGVAKIRRGVSTPAGKPAPLPRGGKIPVSKAPPSKRRG